MLFEDDRLVSIYDFDRDFEKGMDIHNLCIEIKSKSQKIIKILEKGEDIKLYHTDNNGSAAVISHENFEKLFDASQRTISEIKDMLERPGDKDDSMHSTIAKRLYKIGITKPEQDGYEQAGYFKLLYFFYMLDNFIYPDLNVLLLIGKEKDFSSDLIPVRRSGNGDVLFFIRENLFDDSLARRLFCMYYDQITEYLKNIDITLRETLSEDTIFENEQTVKKILEGIEELNLSAGNKEKEICFPVYDMLDYIYRYEKIAYTNEMLKTMTDKKSSTPFLFDMPDIDLFGTWTNRYVYVDEIDDFLEEDLLLAYCKQKTPPFSKNEKRNFKNSKAVRFIKEWISYDKEQMEDYQTVSGYFIELEDNREKIAARKIAVAIKAYNELGETLFTKRYDRTYHRWQKTIKMRSALSKNDRGEKPIMVAMDLFNLACLSQYVCSVYPGGYKYFFKDMIFSEWLILYKTMNGAFRLTYDDRIDYFKSALSIIEQA